MSPDNSNIIYTCFVLDEHPHTILGKFTLPYVPRKGEFVRLKKTVFSVERVFYLLDEPPVKIICRIKKVLSGSSNHELRLMIVCINSIKRIDINNLQATFKYYNDLKWMIVGIFETEDIGRLTEQKEFLRHFPELNCIYLSPVPTGEKCIRLNRNGAKYFQQSDFPNQNSSKEFLYSKFRKPDTGMVMLAIDEVFGKRPDKVVLVGTEPKDIKTAIAAGVSFLHTKDWVK